MINATTKSDLLQGTNSASSQLFDNWFDPIENRIRHQVRGLIEAMICSELDAVLARPRYGRRAKSAEGEEAAGAAGHRHGSRVRTLTGTFGKTEITVPRARLKGADGKTTEWKSQALRAYQRRTRAADALIAGAYLSGTNTRRVRRALVAVFRGAVSKDTVSRVWRKVRGDWEAWNRRSLADEAIVRLILDGTVVRVRLDNKATAISLLVVLAVREDGQKVLLAVQNMGGETQEAWREVLDDLVKRGLRKPADRRRRCRPGCSSDGALGRRADPALHRAQASQSARPRAGAAARRDQRRLHRHDLRGDARGGAEAAPSLPAQVAAAPPRRRR